MIERCLKEETGKCGECPALEHGLNLIKNKVPYQEVIVYLKDTQCHPGFEPTAEISVKESTGEIVSIVIEGEPISK